MANAACTAREDAWESVIVTHALRLPCEIDAALNCLAARQEFASA